MVNRALASPAGHHRRRDDRGGVWIVTGIVLGALVYAGCVIMAAAGFSAVVPLVVVPPVLLGIIAANSLLGGGRDHRRSEGRPNPPPEGPTGHT